MPFDKLRANGPFVVSLSNHERLRCVAHFVRHSKRFRLFSVSCTSFTVSDRVPIASHANVRNWSVADAIQSVSFRPKSDIKVGIKIFVASPNDTLYIQFARLRQMTNKRFEDG